MQRSGLPDHLAREDELLTLQLVNRALKVTRLQQVCASAWRSPPVRALAQERKQKLLASGSSFESADERASVLAQIKAARERIAALGCVTIGGARSRFA